MVAPVKDALQEEMPSQSALDSPSLGFVRRQGVIGKVGADWIHPTLVLPNGVDLGFGSAPPSEDFYGDVASDAVVDCRSKPSEGIGLAILGYGDLPNVVCLQLIERTASLCEISSHGVVLGLKYGDHLVDD